MILIPKYKTTSVSNPIESPPVGLSGEYRIKRYNSMGKLNYDSGWTKNLITILGLNMVGSQNGWANYFSVGSDGSPTQPTDIDIGSWLESSNASGGADVVVLNGAPDYEFSKTKTKRFNLGSGPYTVSEMTIGLNNNGTSIFSRTVVSPAVSKATDEVLDVLYRLTYWPPIGDVLGTANIDGITYDTITRGLNYLSNTMSVLDGQIFGQSSLFQSDWQAYDGDLSPGAEGIAPQGGFDAGNANAFNTAYVLDSFQQDMGINIGLDEWNTPLGGIRSVRISTTLKRGFQTQFNAQGTGNRIPKDNTRVIENAIWRLTWINV